MPIAREPLISRISAEELVAAVAGQPHGHMSPYEVREQQGRDLRNIGEGLVIGGRKFADAGERVGFGGVELRMIGAEMRGDRCRMRCLVEAGSSKPIVKLFTGRFETDWAMPTMLAESMPPDRNAPTGTSAARRRATASRSNASSASAASFSSPGKGASAPRNAAPAADQ